jgi:hypothetical protein
MLSKSRESKKRYYIKNREKISEYRKEHHRRNKEYDNERNRKYYKENKEKLRITRRNYRINNRDKVNVQMKKWRDKNPENQKKAMARWKKKNKNNKTAILKNKARGKAKYKLDISKKICEDCKINKANHRHHEDYSKPLDVIYLCYKCHGIRTRKFDKIERREIK